MAEVRRTVFYGRQVDKFSCLQKITAQNSASVASVDMKAVVNAMKCAVNI